MADINANYFVLLGGNDGWLESPHLKDQLPLWEKGKYIQIPLEISKVQAEFNLRTMKISPRSQTTSN